MEHLVLIVWSALMAGALADVAVDHRREVPIHFPTVPVPAGDTLSAARSRTAKRTFLDGDAWQVRGPMCMSDCGGQLASRRQHTQRMEVTEFPRAHPTWRQICVVGDAQAKAGWTSPGEPLRS